MIDLAPQFHTDLRTNLHVYCPLIQESKRGPQAKVVPVSQVLHYCLGHLIGQEPVEVYVLFPLQWLTDKPTNFLGKRGGTKHGILER
jgi:hypothetical protein